jgi:general nucleoside transport system permease protein
VSEIFDLGLIGSAIRLTSPILLAALGGLFTDRAGMFNISLEGQMLVAAFFGVAGLYWTQSAWIGLLLGVAAATALSLVFGLWVIRLDGDAIIVGLAINLLAVGLTAYLTLPVFGVQGSFDDPALQGLPTLLGHSPLVYLGVVLVPASWWLLFRHPAGVRLRAVGEDPEAAEGAGIDPVRTKFAACAICGVLCGLAGAQLALALVTQWVQGMTAGRGFIALVAIMLARSHPVGVALSSLLFGFAYALAVRLQGVGIPPQFVSMLPYVLTIAVLVAMQRRGKLRLRRAPSPVAAP